ncbi:hypothetical protein BDV25DRAFT_172522 [Aspergillus avenaceus]|uniref:Endonuclease n=1 Tax=Aspergillus avenaceus TaxID=36643 RepID=A0A5N6TV10_ASPAV|nr:hypothetical protein BDV25DRAFT_172522 [Aspergillus avenaceus]
MSKGRSLAIAALGATAGAGSAVLYTKQNQPVREVLQPVQDGIQPIPQSKSFESPGITIASRSLAKPSPGIAILQDSSGGPVTPDGILKYGHPGPVNDELNTISHFGAYDRRTRNPIWVAEHMTPESIAMGTAERKNNFKLDRSIPAAFRARVADYTNSGYDKGHQVPCDPSKWSQDACDSTFKMSNMCPQVGVGFNRHYWAYFEAFCQRLTTKYPSVRVITGPLYMPEKGDDGKYRVSYEVIGKNNVAVPTHFYKIIFAEEENDPDSIGSEVAVGAFVLPNGVIDKDTYLGDYEVDLAHVERAAGLEFAQNLKSSQRKRLCEEVKCDHNVKDFSDAVEDLTDEFDRAKL